MKKYLNKDGSLKNYDKLHFLFRKKCKKKFRTNEELFKFINKYKENIKNIEIFINDYIIVKYDKI